MKEDKILIIDLKERLCDDSVILNIDENHTSSMTLDFNLGKNNDKVLQCIKNREIDKSLLLLKNSEKIAKQQFIKNNYPVEVRKNLILNRFANAANHAEEAISEDKSIENFLKCKDASKKISKTYINNVYNEMPELTETYEFFTNKLKEKVNSYNTEELIRALKGKLIKEDKLNQYINVSPHLKKVIGTTEEGKALLLHIEEVNKALIEEFNSGINRNDVLKKIFGQDYKDFLNSNELNKYLEALNSKYESYEEIKKSMEVINNIYLMNTANNFDAYYNPLMSIYIIKLINITSYLREYIARTMFNDKIKYYCVEEIEQRIDDLINEVNLSNYPTMIPI